MNRKRRARGRLSILWTTALGLLLLVTACQGGPPPPTLTAVPLKSTVTPAPGIPMAAEGPAQTPISPSPTVPLAARASVTPDLTSAEIFAQLDDQLAKATVHGFLDRLTAGDAASAARLFLTKRAQAGEAGQLLSQLVSDDRDLAQATLMYFLWTSDTAYEAEAELRWDDRHERDRPAQQTLVLILTNEQGLWLIDQINLGTLQMAPATPTAAPRVAPPPPPDQEGRLVLQASSGGEIYVVNADGSELRRLTDGLDPAWSPDGTKIAFTRWRNPWGAYLINPDGSGEERIVDGVRLKEIAWSSDGSQVAFTVNHGTTEEVELCFYGFCFTLPPYYTGQLWTADLQTGALLSLPLDDRGVHAPAWSPGGHRIVYAGERGLAWIDLETMETGRFANSSVWDGSPTFSPDGQQIAFMSRVHDRWEIMIMNADGSGRRQLTGHNLQQEIPPSNVSPAWSPDGKQIAFLSNRAGPWRIYVIQADGTKPRPMFGKELDMVPLRYEWASERVLSWSQ